MLVVDNALVHNQRLLPAAPTPCGSACACRPGPNCAKCDPSELRRLAAAAARKRPPDKSQAPRDAVGAMGPTSAKSKPIPAKWGFAPRDLYRQVALRRAHIRERLVAGPRNLAAIVMLTRGSRPSSLPRKIFKAEPGRHRELQTTARRRCASRSAAVPLRALRLDDSRNRTTGVRHFQMLLT